MSAAPHFALGLDSAMNGCGAALLNTQTPDKSRSHRSSMIRGQAEAIIPMAQAAVAESGARFQDIGLIVTTIGPGTFTGLRVGMSAAKSFALALNIPLIGVTTFDVLARMYQNAPEQLVCVLIETKRADYYVQIFDPQRQALSAPQALEFSALCDLLAQHTRGGALIGDAALRFWEECAQKQAFPNNFAPAANEVLQDLSQPDPLILAQIGLEQFLLLGDSPQNPIEPLYLRGADVSTPKTPPRILHQRV